MKVKSIFETELREQKAEIARQTLTKVFRGGIPTKTTMASLLKELEDDEILWQVFGELTFGDFKEMIVPSPDAFGPPGPSRKRGVTSSRIIEYLRANPGARRCDIMQTLSLKGGTVSSQLRTLRQSGRLIGKGEERNLRYYIGDVDDD